MRTSRCCTLTPTCAHPPPHLPDPMGILVLGLSWQELQLMRTKDAYDWLPVSGSEAVLSYFHCWFDLRLVCQKWAERGSGPGIQLLPSLLTQSGLMNYLGLISEHINKCNCLQLAWSFKVRMFGSAAYNLSICTQLFDLLNLFKDLGKCNGIEPCVFFNCFWQSNFPVKYVNRNPVFFSRVTWRIT